MGSVYTLPLKLPEENATTVYKNVTVGSKNLQFRFQWAIASEEQYNIVMAYLKTKTDNDPLYVNGSYSYDYNFVEYYYPFSQMTDEQIGEWLDEAEILPASIVNAERPSQLLMIKTRAQEAAAVAPIIAQYREVLKWQFHMIYEGETTVGVIEPGGWYRSQDTELQFRFVSPLSYIGRNDFERVTIEFEVDNA